MEVREAAQMAAAAAAGGGGGGGRPPPPNPALPYREDCWSEGETAALVEAWGSRYLELNRGNLRQKQWQEVADAVNARLGAAARRRPPRTDVQCKNRVDTLKKKYKAERLRAAPSAWPFFSQLDLLVGPTLSASAAGKKPSPSQSPAIPVGVPLSASRKPPSPSSSPSPPPPLALPLPNYRRGSPLPAAAFIQKAAAAAAAAASESDDSDDDNSQQSVSRSVSSRSGKRGRDAPGGVGGGADGGFRELARAIEAFAEMYERVEDAKQRQAVEMERQRIEFLKQLELQRMQSFVDAQVRLEKAKRAKKRAGAAADATGAAELFGSVAALPFLSTPTYF